MRAAKAVNIAKTRSNSRVVRRTISREYFLGTVALEVTPVEEAITLVVPRIRIPHRTSEG
jgi:hypothetical protein